MEGLSLAPLAGKPLPALQLTNVMGGAIGAIAIVELAFTFGASVVLGVICSLPYLTSNSVVRYSTGAYPNGMALGLGLWAMTVLVKSTSRSKLDLNSTDSIFFGLMAAGVLLGFAGLFHAVVLVSFPGFFLVPIFQPKGWNLRIKSTAFFLLGFLGTFVLGLVIWNSIRTQHPSWVLNSTGNLIWNNKGWNFKLTAGINNFVSVLFPGIHTSQRFLDLLLNLPRAFGAFL